MKLLLDQGLARSTARMLWERGHEAVHVGDCGLATASDLEILDFARQAERTIVTLDADFHALLALSKADGPSVIRIRVEGLKAGATADLIEDVCRRCAAPIGRGCLLSATADQVRFRRLPIGG